MRLNRLIKILVLLANDNRVTARTLAEKFSVSRKTIYQDLDVLILSGVPVIYGHDHSGLITLVEGFNFPKSFIHEVMDKKRPSSQEIYTKYVDHEQSMTHTLSLWKQFVQRRIHKVENLDNTLFQSWIRCQQQNVPIYEVDPTNILSPKNLEPYILYPDTKGLTPQESMFCSIFYEINWSAMVYNIEGHLTKVINPVEDYEALYPQVGYYYDTSEEKIGTNAVHLALMENRVVMTRGAEHYNKTFHGITGIAAPIYKKDVLVGALNVIFIRTNVNQQVNHIVNSMARLYETLVLKEHHVKKEMEKRIYDEDSLVSVKLPRLYGKSLHWERVMNIANHMTVMTHHISIYGPNSVGKTSIGKYIHAKSTRKYGPNIIIDGNGKIGDWKIYLFGKENSTTGVFENCEGGMILFKNPHCLQKSIQKQLAKYLRTGKIRRVNSKKETSFDVRMCFMIDTDCEGHWQEDLKEELSLLMLHVQSLENRKEDIEAIVSGWCKEEGHSIYKDKRVYKKLISCLEEKKPKNVNMLKLQFHEVLESF